MIIETEDNRNNDYFLIKHTPQYNTFCHPVLIANLLNGVHCSLSITKKQRITLHLCCCCTVHFDKYQSFFVTNKLWYFTSVIHRLTQPKYHSGRSYKYLHHKIYHAKRHGHPLPQPSQNIFNNHPPPLTLFDRSNIETIRPTDKAVRSLTINTHNQCVSVKCIRTVCVVTTTVCSNLAAVVKWGKARLDMPYL
jgi:hypothetical protein